MKNPIITITMENDGIDKIKEALADIMPQSPHFFPDDTLTDQPEKILAAEVMREKLLSRLEDEIPHGIAVTVESMKEREDKEILDIQMNIFCEKKSHKGIVIGKNGTLLKNAATDARLELEQFFGIKVNLQCWVKVKDDWRNSDFMLKNFGLS